MATNSEKNCEGVAESPASTTPLGKQPTEGGDPKTERIKATRHPRWTRQETLVLIEAKKLVENGEQVSRYRSASGLVHTDPKWDLVSSLCQQHGVNRGAVQCRKRWGNLLTDFRKIKKWESNIKEEAESFWIMRNDVRKEKKLPGFFDAVVYNVLDGGKMSWSTEEENYDTVTNGNKVNGPLQTPSPNKTGMRGCLKMTPVLLTLPSSGCQREAMFQEGYKRRRSASDNCEDTTNFNDNVIKVLRRNSNILKAHIGAQNVNYQLARDQQKQQTDSLVTALGKLTDALTKIADKL
ncbi:SANT/Myb domain [Sesbania bispinosa]|nr:SANT/Myb domain [Sesbania bispinosa]